MKRLLVLSSLLALLACGGGGGSSDSATTTPVVTPTTTPATPASPSVVIFPGKFRANATVFNPSAPNASALMRQIGSASVASTVVPPASFLGAHNPTVLPHRADRANGYGTLLPNGWMLITGGKSDHPISAGKCIELFNPVDEMFYETTLPIMDRAHVFSNLVGNKVYLYGGPLDSKWNYESLAVKQAQLNRITVLDLDTETLSEGPSFQFDGQPVIGCKTTMWFGSFETSECWSSVPSSWVLNEHEILVAFSADFWYTFSFDPTTGKIVKPIFCAEAGAFGNASVFDGERYLYYLRGFNSKVSRLYKFDIQSQTQTLVGTVDSPDGSHMFYHPSNKTVYIFGGWAPVSSKIYSYDTTSGAFGKIADLPKPIGFQMPMLLPNGRILLLGGMADIEGSMTNNDIFSNAQVIFDPKTNTAGYTGKMLGHRANFLSAHLPTGRILLVGATPGDRPSEIFEPEANVYVTYDKTRIPAGANYQFQAEYKNGVVNWTAEQGSIDSTGFYTAPWDFTINKDWITATSTTDSTKWGMVPMSLVRAEDVLLVSVPPVVKTTLPVQLEVAVFWFDNKNVTWEIASTPKDAFATIDQTGLFTADKVGDYLIKVTSAVDTRYTTVKKVTVE